MATSEADATFPAAVQRDSGTLLERCGRFCIQYVTLHNRISRQAESPRSRLLEVDCVTYSCGGLGNILLTLSQWAFLAYLTDRAIVYRLPPSYRFHTWLSSPFFAHTAPPERAFPYTYAGSFIQTMVMRRGDDLEQVQRRLELLRTKEPSSLLKPPLVVVRPDTVLIVPELLKNRHVQERLTRDGFPFGNFSSHEVANILLAMLVQPTVALWTRVSSHLDELRYPDTYRACHVRSQFLS